MNKTWLILGATSIIAENFAHIVAKNNYKLILAGRNLAQLQIIQKDIQLRYQINCELFEIDFYKDYEKILQYMQKNTEEFYLFIAYSEIIENQHLTTTSIQKMVNTNITTTIQLIFNYFSKAQLNYKLIFLSSVAAAHGKEQNSLYGSTKAAIEVYLTGLQHLYYKNQNITITIVRLGYIDTQQTFGLPNIFYAANPAPCAQACWQGLKAKKRFFYYPFFWRFICQLINILPFFIIQRLLQKNK